MLKVLRFFSFLLCLFIASAALANTSDSKEQPALALEGASQAAPSIPEALLPKTGTSQSSLKSEHSATTTSWPMVILALMGVVAFIFLLAWAAKRLGGLSAMGVKDMKIVAAIPVGTKERVAILDIKGQQFLLGITGQSINHLHTFPEPVVDTNAEVKGEFAEKLAQIMGQKNQLNDTSRASKHELGD